MKKFEFSWSRFFSVAMCGAMLLFAGCEEIPEDPNDGDDSTGTFKIEFSNVTKNNADVAITSAIETKANVYAIVYDAEVGVEGHCADFATELAGNWAADYLVDLPYNTNFRDWIFYGMGQLMADVEYIVIVAPEENPSVENMEYVIYKHEPVTINYTVGETTANATLTQDSNGPSYVNVKVALTEGAQYFYGFIQEKNWGTGMTDAEVLEYLNVANGTPTTQEMVTYDGDPNTEVRLLVYVFDSNYVGKVVTAKFSTAALTFSTTASINNHTINKTGLDNVNVTLTVKGTIKKLLYVYYLKSDVDSSPEFYGPTPVENQLAQLGEEMGTSVEAVAGHTYTFNLDKMKSQVVYVMGIDDKDVPTHVYHFNVNTEDAFKFNSEASLPTVTAVSYCFELAMDANYNNDYANSTWTNMDTVTSPEAVFMETSETYTSCKYAAFKFEFNWGSITPLNVWVLGEDMLEYNPLTGVAQQDAMKVVNLGNLTANPTVAYSGYVMTRMAKYDADYNATYSPMSFYIVYEDANGVSPYIKVTPEDYMAKE